MMKFEQSCGIIPVYLENGKKKILILKGRHGHWGFPKGHIEGGENCIVTAKREFTEETGIPAEYIDIVDDKNFQDDYWFVLDGEKIHKRVKYYLGFLKEGFDKFITPQQGEIYEIKLIPIEEMNNFIKFNSLRKIIENLKDYLK